MTARCYASRNQGVKRNPGPAARDESIGPVVNRSAPFDWLTN
jgi:hypothetical protein